ncbi:substance-P receptor-like [Antedon mediterranea]|uniref:substance-P receptor-like n=1 Tax=Antedon mediterranea TaxID=105859 RepID=UPI003AF5AB05
MSLDLENAFGQEIRKQAGVWLCIYAVIGIIGIFANLLVLAVFLVISNCGRNMTAALLTHQSVIDLLSSVVFLPFYVIPEGWFITNKDAGDVFCKGRSVFWVLATTSTMNLVLITVERYYAIVHPIKHYVHYKNIKLWRVLPIVYIYALFTQGHLFFVAQIDEDFYCFYNWSNTNENLQAIIGMQSFIFSWLIPIIIIVFAYSTILLSIRKMDLGFPNGYGSGGSRRRFIAQKNLTNTFIAVSIAFAVCWTPDMFLYLTYNVSSGTLPKNMENGIGHRLTVLLSVCNMVVNPFIYTCKYKKFKTGLSKMFIDIKISSRQTRISNINVTDCQTEL